MCLVNCSLKSYLFRMDFSFQKSRNNWCPPEQALAGAFLRLLWRDHWQQLELNRKRGQRTFDTRHMGDARAAYRECFQKWVDADTRYVEDLNRILEDVGLKKIPHQVERRREMGKVFLPCARHRKTSIWRVWNAKTDISVVINFRYLRLKMVKDNGNNKNRCNIITKNYDF